MSEHHSEKNRDVGRLDDLKSWARNTFLANYSITGNGVAHRQASDYLADEKVVSFLKEAEQVKVTR
ncbi:hypothetical protein [Marinobacter alexandrii]|uniref:hypothetical protein n=1 Tax=Marinobacter alexandrii TaxID=2570351 RepID=UPI0032665E32